MSAASSPALSASSAGRLVFTVFEDDGHAIYVLDPDQMVSLVPAPAQSQAALLPGRTTPGGDVYTFLSDTARGLPSAAVVPQAGTGWARRHPAPGTRGGEAVTRASPRC